MSDYGSTHSVARDSANVKGDSSQSTQQAHFLRAVLLDTRLRTAGMSLALLAWLVAAGAAEAMYRPDVYEIADDLDMSTDSVYKGLRRLTDWGYVERAQIKSQRLLMRLVWPKTKPAKSRRKKTRRG